MTIPRSSSSNEYGQQIAAFRKDELDQSALRFVSTLTQDGLPRVLDLGCGAGAMSVALAIAGARVVAVDREDVWSELETRCEDAGLATSTLDFVRGIAPACLIGLVAEETWHAVYSQRMLHYMTYGEAREALAQVRRQTRSGGRLYLGVSGLTSELGDGYSAAKIAVQERFSRLAPEQQARHQIRQPVCLYTSEELRLLVTNCGYSVQRVWLSDFGNVKLEAVAGG